ncbi:MAG: glutamate--tRNA ligase [Bauldia sp.]
MVTNVRFAPSPTGFIHVGNARTALFNWLITLQEKGRFLLRFDDTDAKRSRIEHADAIEEDLAWLGVRPASVFRQSDRMALYEAAADRLRASGRLYACYETEDELEAMRASRRRRGLPPVYDRSALRLTAGDRAAHEANGRRPHWRFLLGDPAAATASGHVGWIDRFRGEQSIDLAALSDPVLIREDGSFLYTLPSVVDDVDTAITDVIRGEDHVTNTAVQIELFRALGAEPPRFGHHNLLVTPEGEGLSKRTGAQSIASLREAGYEPMAVAAVAALIGTSEAVEPAADLDDLARRFAAAKVSRSPARFDPAELDNVNARIVHERSFAEVADRLAALGVGGGEAFWLAVRGNCVRVSDAAGWWTVVTGPLSRTGTPTEEAAFLASARALLPDEPWGPDTWSAWTTLVKAATGRSGKSLYMPLRRALTGADHGPELAALLPLIGRTEVLARLG